MSNLNFLQNNRKSITERYYLKPRNSHAAVKITIKHKDRGVLIQFFCNLRESLPKNMQPNVR